MNSLFSKLLIGVALGAGLAGCTAAHGGSAGASSAATSRAASASRVAVAASSSIARSAAARSPAARSPAATPTSAAATATVTGVGVVADCAGAAPFPLSKEPASIILACADSGIGIQDLDWTSWSAATAAGTGLLWENLCTPSCADGTYGHYPVAVTLTAVKDSAKGEWFSRLSLSWEGSRPANQTPDSFQLMQPSS